MKIAIAGSGALGSCFGAMLYLAGNEVTLIDSWQEHIKKIQGKGLNFTYNGTTKNVKIPIVEPIPFQNIKQKFDLIIVLTKAMQLEEMMKTIAPKVEENTGVLCLLNGIGHDEVIEKYIDKKNFLLGNTMWSASMKSPGVVALNPDGSIDLKNMGDSGVTRAKSVVATLLEAGLNARYASDVMASIYKKLCVNATMNGLCTILDGNLASVGSTKIAEGTIGIIVSEIIEVAKKEGVKLQLEEILENICATFDPDGIGVHFPSMHQDLIKNNRLTEIDYINGAIVKKGLKYGVSTPYNAFLTELVHAKEQLLGL